MRRAEIDGTKIGVSALAFGTASLHHVFSSATRQRLLHKALSVGITHFDTSPYYGYGLAEADVGAFCVGRRSDITIATKVGLYPRGFSSTRVGAVWLRKAAGKIIPPLSAPAVSWAVDRARNGFRDSLRRLRTDYVDFLLLHEPEMRLVEEDEFLRWLEDELTQGTVRSWGVAGVRQRVLPWVEVDHPLARVVQTEDSVDARQADFLSSHGRKFQFTYGYLSGSNEGLGRLSAEDVVRQALNRNATGSVIVSTRKVERVDTLAKGAS